MRLLLISTYELGRQPLHVASPAAALRAAGHDVDILDLAVDDLDLDRPFDAVAISVPMHTAARLAARVVDAVGRARPGVPIALYGLYAGEGSLDGVGARFVGEYEPDLVAWADDGAPPIGTRLSVATGRFRPPARDGLPSLDRYGRLDVDGEVRLVGSVEASHGCRHRCRHCPIPAVYDGRYRIVDRSTVMSDVDALVEAGAAHVTWGDPDFLNGPRHAVDLLESVHRRHPTLTHDLTIKVEHLLRHHHLLPRLAASGVLFVVSAFETTDDHTLALLDKGHTVADMAETVRLVRDAGLDVHPSWMPFVPWTTPEDVIGIFRFLAAHDLLGSTDPVQLSIRLLIPRHSLMLELDEVRRAIGAYDENLLTFEWRATDPRTDPLQERLAARAEHAAAVSADPVDTLITMWQDTLGAAGQDPAVAERPEGITRGRPRLTEAWFCCAEPTTLQSTRIVPVP